MAIVEVDGKDDENLTSFRKNLRRMVLLEDEARRRREGQEARKFVSIRVGKIEALGSPPERSFVKDKRRVFESPRGEGAAGKVRERVETLDKKVGASSGVGDGEDGSGFVCGGAEVVSEEEASRLSRDESMRIVEECKLSVAQGGCDEGPKYKDDGNECFHEISVEDIKRNLLAELDEEKESGASIARTVVESEALMQAVPEAVVYVDAPEDKATEMVKNPYSISCNIHICDSHYKISDLSKDGKASGCVQAEEKEVGGVDGCSEGAVTYRDPAEDEGKEGWFSAVLGSVFSICCGRSE